MPKMTRVQKARCENSEEGVGVVLDRFLLAADLDLSVDTLRALLKITAMAYEHRITGLTIGQYHLDRLAEVGLIVIDADDTVILPAA